MYSYNYLFFQILIFSFSISINQLKSVHPFGTTAGVIRVKGTVQRDFGPPFFSSLEPSWATDQQVTTCSILVQILPRYSYFSESPRGIIPGQVNLPRVSYPGESSDFSGS